MDENSKLAIMKISQKALQRVLPVPSTNEISIYNDRLAEDYPDEILIATNRLRAAFPKMKDDFFDLLSERIVSNGFTLKRLNDAVNSVVDSFAYKELNISDVIKFDRKIKLHSYSEVSEMVTAGKASFDDYEKMEINGVLYRVLKSDLL